MRKTVEYLKTRIQFGATLSRFQALQHRAVDMLMALEQARSMAMFATLMVGEKDLEERVRFSNWRRRCRQDRGASGYRYVLSGWATWPGRRWAWALYILGCAGLDRFEHALRELEARLSILSRY
ncbi:acyl-CoA dehydrogenase family protein [Bradyrhizobium valentinum]|uniref:acyl-CoA dehydrogenase family protein n=1 Tax=Bradyrhizobium valentinum TaxID=1518501 RepID=UPI0007138803|nr:hypothetical protein CQ10_38765 [Bradyrhizobium valentinum]